MTVKLAGDQDILAKLDKQSKEVSNFFCPLLSFTFSAFASRSTKMV